MHSLQDCIRICRQEYPEKYISSYIEFGGKYYFNLLDKGLTPETGVADIHMVDPETGDITGSLPTVTLMAADERFRDAWKTAKKPDTAEHSAFFQESSGQLNGYGWSVRRSDDELEHYGIKGQKWGVVNGPPYPLDPKVSKQIKQGKNEGISVEGESKGLDPDTVTAAKTIGKKILTNIILPRVVAKAAVQVYQRISQNRRTKQSKELSEALIGDISEHKDYERYEEPKKIKGEHTIEEDMAAVNPNYAGMAVPGTTNNCVLCAYTYDMRRRGYDVTAKPSVRGNWNGVLMQDLYDHPHKDTLRAFTWNGIYNKAAKKYPEGSRGVIGVSIPWLGGHSMAWEIHDGKLNIIDGQRNVYSSVEELSKAGYNPLSVEFIRTDHLRVRPDQINRVANELKPDWKKTVKERHKNQAISAWEKENRSRDSKETKPMTKQEKKESLRKIWMKEHKNTLMDAKAMDSMERWVESNMWSVRMKGDSSESLTHYGIKGQMWGVRRFQNEDGSLTPAGKERYYDSGDGDKDKKDHQTGTNKNGEPVKVRPKGGNKESESWKADEAKDLTDEELNRRTNRLQREKQYQDLLNPPKKNGGSSWLKDVAKEAAKAVFVTAAVTPLAVVMGRKYKYLFGKARDWLHKIAGKPLQQPTAPNYFEGKKK